MSITLFDSIVLSSGGFKGFIQLGSLQLLVEKGLNYEDINVFSGCSIGSVICLLLAVGYSPLSIFEKVSKTTFGSFIKINSLQEMYSRVGLLSIDDAFVFLDNLVKEKIGCVPTLLELKEKYGKKVYSCVLNLGSCACEYLSYENHPDMLCTQAAKLSSNLPIIFGKIIERGNIFVDGGLKNGIPYEPVFRGRDRILAIATPGACSESSTDGIGYLHNVIATPINALMEQRLSKLPENVIPIVIRKDGIPILDIGSNLDEKVGLFTLGYQRTRRIFEMECIKIDIPDILWSL